LLPKDKKERLNLDVDRIKYWLEKGAKPSDRIARFLGEANIIPKPAQRNNPNKAKPKKKAQERLAAAEEAKKAAEEAVKAEAEKPAEEAEEVVKAEAEKPAEPTPAPANEAPAEETKSEEKPAEEPVKEEEKK
jgi:small subunit ribosomal protein S16